MRSSSSSTATSSTPRPTGRSSAAAGFVRRQVDAVVGARAAPPAHGRLPLLLRAHARAAVGPVPDPRARCARSRSCTTSARTSAASRRQELAFGKKAGAEVVGSYDAIRWVPEAEMIPPGIDVTAIEPVAAVRPRAARHPARAVVAPPQGNGGGHRRVRGARRRPRARRGAPSRRGVRALSRGRHRRRPAATPAGTGCSRSSAWRSASRSSRSCTTRPSRGRRSELGTRVPIVSATKETLARSSSRSSPRQPSGKRIGAESRAYVEQVHDLERVADRLLALYARCEALDTADLTAHVVPALRSGASSSGSASTRRSTGSAGSSRASSPSSSCRSTRATSRPPTTGRSRR